MKPEDKELYNEKIDRLEEETDLKLNNLKTETNGEIGGIRVLLEEKILPLLEATHDQAKKTNGRVTKIEQENKYTQTFKKNVSESVAVLKKELDIVRFFSRHPVMISLGGIVLYVGMIFSDEMSDIIIKLIF